MAAGRRRVRRVLIGLLAVYAALLLVGGVALSGLVERQVRARIARALGADEVTIGSTSLSLWRGRLVLEDVAARREGGGMAMTIGSVDVDLAGWGAVVVDRRIRRVAVRGLDLDLSARALVDAARRDRTPVAIDELLIEDARLAVAPSALLPGLGRASARLARAEARDTGLSGALSWLAGLTALDGELSLPGGVSAAVAYRPGSLSLRGRFTAEKGLSVPFRIPDLDPAGDELDHLRAFAVAGMRAVGGALTGGAAVDAARELLDRVLD